MTIQYDLSDAAWFKSSRSLPNSDACVEAALNLPTVVAVRDSKDAGGPVLVFRRAAWRGLVRGLGSRERPRE
ncbi:hypothetical protein GCM10022221_36600 [Actinocorallia aurea]